MVKLTEILNLLNTNYPFELQESYDNSGLILGNPNAIVHKALICIDLTEAVVKEAIKQQCNVIIAHHPFIFSPINKIILSTKQGVIIENLIKHDIAAVAVHTNFDNAEFGMNHVLAKKFKLKNYKFLKAKKNMLKKLVTFCPIEHAEKLRSALFGAGAGNIGNYSSCSYNSEGTGTFKASENTKPFVGKKHSLHFEKEIRIETIFPAFLEKKIIDALLGNHPYEEVAYDIYSLENDFVKAGEGIVGDLPEAISTEDFLKVVKRILGVGSLRHSSPLSKKIKRVALCGGAGSFLINSAIKNNADAFITGDVKYHQFLDFDKNLLLIDAGHYETEHYAKEIIHDLLIKNFPKFAVRISKVNTNPINYF